MDVSKAKNVVIVLLLAFNIFLLVSSFVFQNSQASAGKRLKTPGRSWRKEDHA